MRNRITCLLLVLFFMAAFFSPAGAAPLFPDVPEEHWARDAVADLATKGILEGYPDGTFKGDRASTRWEMALSLQRILALMQQEHTRFATKAELEALRALATQLKDELNALGVRVKNLEQEYSALDMRTRHLEKVRFYGFLKGNFVQNYVKGVNSAFLGSRLSPVVDWTNGRLLVSGPGFTNLAKFGTMVRATRNTSFGIEIVGFNTTGDSIVTNYWGITPPVLSNPFTGQGTVNPRPQSKNNIPWMKVTLDRFWYSYKPSKTLLTVGAFLNEKTDHIILRGERNPNINPPEILPFYGIDLKGNMSSKENCPWSYEVSYSRLPQASFYSTHLLDATLMYKYDRGEAKIHGMMVKNGAIHDGISYAAGTVNTPTLPAYPAAPGNLAIYWQTAGGSTANNKLGPQSMWIVGANWDHDFSKKWQAYVKGGVSFYDPDKTNVVYTTGATGYAFAVGLKANLDKFDGKLQFQSTSIDYDPFILQYPGPGSGIPVFLPYSSYYANYYQIHDYINYPNNRQGFKLDLGYDFTKKFRAEGQFGYLWQLKPSTVANFITVGTIEPLFPYLQTAGSTVKGNVRDWGIRLRYKFSPEFTGRAGFYNYLQERDTVAIDDVSLREDLAYLNLKYNLTDDFALLGNYYYLKYRGHTGTSNIGFRQHIPSIGADYDLTKAVKVGLTYRYYNHRDLLNSNNDWNANNWMINWKMKF